MGRYRKQAFKNVRPYWDTNSIRYEFTQNKSSAAHSRSLWYLMFFFNFARRKGSFCWESPLHTIVRFFQEKSSKRNFLGGGGRGGVRDKDHYIYFSRKNILRGRCLISDQFLD